MVSGDVGKKTFARLVDLMLEQKGVPRRYLFEYPYSEHESNALIAKAEHNAEMALKILGLTRKR